MLRDITIGQYYPVESKIHTLDPRVKIVAVFVYLISLFLFRGFASYLVVTVFIVAAVVMSRVPFSFMMKGLKPVLFLVCFTAFFNVFFTPGDVLFKNNEKARKTVNKYFSLDFADNNGKLGLGHGQLTACVLIGGLGYFKAAHDRGKQNFLETLFRYPLVGFYVITGSELLEKGFKKILKDKKGYKEIIDHNLNVKKFSELSEIAQRLAKENKTDINKEFKSLVSKKAIIGAVPFAFSIAVMGLFVAGISRAFTQYRYNQEQKEKAKNSQNNFLTFDSFQKSLNVK